jgi:hypothetical protein
MLWQYSSSHRKFSGNSRYLLRALHYFYPIPFPLSSFGVPFSCLLYCCSHPSFIHLIYISLFTTLSKTGYLLVLVWLPYQLTDCYTLWQGISLSACTLSTWSFPQSLDGACSYSMNARRSTAVDFCVIKYHKLLLLLKVTGQQSKPASEFLAVKMIR